MKVIFTDKPSICIGQGDGAGAFVWCGEASSNSTVIDDMGLMSVKGPGEVALTSGIHNFLQNQ